MFKKLFFLVFTFSLIFTSLGTNNLAFAASKTAITSNMYGKPYNDYLQFDSKACSDDYKRLNVSIKEARIEDYKAKSTESGIAGKIFDVINRFIFDTEESFTNFIFQTGCQLGVAPSQLLQLIFFPIVFDNYSFLKDISTVVQTISICVLAVVTALSFYELNKREGSIEQELFSKLGKFLIAAGIISFSKYILQGIFDIANILSYYISNYTVNIHMDPAHPHITLPVELLDYPTVFFTYLQIAFGPSGIWSSVLTDLMLNIIMILKIVLLCFMLKDLLRIATWGMKRIVTLIASPVLLPILAGLIPSYKTQDIFNKYFRSIIASAFVPVLFGLIYLASAPFVIEDLVNIIDAPVLKVIVLGFFLNILSSIPNYCDNLIGSSTSLGNPYYDKGLPSLPGSVRNSGVKTFHGYHNTKAGMVKQGIKDTSFRNVAKTQVRNRFFHGGKK